MRWCTPCPCGLISLQGLSVRQQAALWSSASVVLHGHGAAIGNYFMLPHHAVGVQLAPMMGGYHPDRWTDSLVRQQAGRQQGG